MLTISIERSLISKIQTIKYITQFSANLFTMLTGFRPNKLFIYRNFWMEKFLNLAKTRVNAKCCSQKLENDNIQFFLRLLECATNGNIK